EELSDQRPDFLASGSEWRTPPLWGIGLTAVVQGRTEFLHDGRARSLMEAILWHGGEAEQAREAVRTMPATDRDALIAFLQSL
ncbi:MAG: thiol oxidoreductase, partial [Haliea sp.]|nr:thiol oxidoreductase [Haliea sp.]